MNGAIAQGSRSRQLILLVVLIAMLFQLYRVQSGCHSVHRETYKTLTNDSIRPRLLLQWRINDSHYWVNIVSTIVKQC